MKSLNKEDLERYLEVAIREVEMNKLSMSQFLGYYMFYSSCVNNGIANAKLLAKALLNAQVILLMDADSEKLAQIKTSLSISLDESRGR